MYYDDVKLRGCLTVSVRIIGAKHAPPVGDLSMPAKKIDQTPSFPQQSAVALPIKKYAAACVLRGYRLSHFQDAFEGYVS
jgi:hypothetical protein